jgi:predicted nucleotidyltransferase
MSTVLSLLAEEVGTSERTLRRGISDGLIHARRPSPRRLTMPEDEATWIRAHWPLVTRLRGAFRTEPNVALAVLFGSTARGDEITGASDLDLLIDLHRSSPGALDALRRRLGDRLGIEMLQIVSLDAAQRNPRLLSEILRDGRPLVDRGQTWPRLRAQTRRVRMQAEHQEDRSYKGALAALEYFRELAATREHSPVYGPL